MGAALGGGSRLTIARRATSAWGLFPALKPLLEESKGNKVVRMQLLDATVGAGLLWLVQTLALTQQDLRYIHGVHSAMLSKVMGSRPFAGETWTRFRARRRTWGTWLLRIANKHRWERRAVMLQWAWAGHVAVAEGKET